jgi:transcriptional regulator with XRE-family HTH domain
METFGPYLKRLRRTGGLSLKQVEEAAAVSNAYLSQIERGIRKPPHPDILKRLAKTYDVPVEELLEAAGYLEDAQERRLQRQKIERAFEHVITDPQYRHGTRLKGSALSLDVKRFIVEVYEKKTGRKLLAET